MPRLFEKHQRDHSHPLLSHSRYTVNVHSNDESIGKYSRKWGDIIF